MPAVAGIDSSTQSVKVEVRDYETGEVRGIGRASHPETTPPRSEQDPGAWWSALVEAFRQVRHLAGDVAAISIGGQQHGMVVSDANGEVIRPAKLWNDTESAAEADELVRLLGAPVWAERCGSVPVAAFTVTKLAWLARHEPDSYARIASVMLPHDWLTWKLTGQRVTDRGDASGTGYYSAAAGDWCFDLLELVGPQLDWPSIVPRVLGPWDQAGQLLPSAAAELGLNPGIVVGVGSGDNMAAALGLGLGIGDIAMSFGTSGTVYAVSAKPTADPTGCVAGFADASGAFLPLVCTLNATKVTNAIAILLGVDHDAFTQLALSAPSGSGGVVVLPYFDGERTPNRPKATGSIAGLRSNMSREQLARASVEGVVCGLLDGVDALAAAGVPTDGRVLLLGGGARSAAYREVAAQLLERPVTIPEADEHVAAGMCVQAAGALTGDQLSADRWKLGGGSTVEPVTTSDDSRSLSASEVRAAYATVRG